MSSEYVVVCEVERTSHADLPDLVRNKGCERWPSPGNLKGLQRVKPRPPRRVEIVCFTPTFEEHRLCSTALPTAFMKRSLRPATLFELLALIPGNSPTRVQLIEMRGQFLQKKLLAYGQCHRNWARVLEPTYLAWSRYGGLDWGYGAIVTYDQCWYVGYREINDG